jgi:hypothetical protein
MTREEIHEIANTIDPNVGKEIDEDYNCADVYDFTIGFECGAKFIKEKIIDKAVEWVKDRDIMERYLHYRTSLADDYANALRKYLEK